MVKNVKNDSVRVAIACQGGGSHTAFTAGVLKTILREKNGNYEIVALSGTSGGAICALLAWYGLLTDDRDEAVRLLDSFWTENSASSLWDMFLNNLTVGTARLQDVVAIPEASPYTYPSWAQDYLRSLLEKNVDFDKIKTLSRSSSPVLLVGAVDVLSGKFKVLRNSEIGVDGILASAALPTFFRAVGIDGTVYWDGLFSQNPPIRDFVQDPDASVKPDEIWVIQINPETRKKEPRSTKEITDRRNELSGNLSLNQELDFIDSVNKWVDSGYLPQGRYKRISVRRIEMLRDLDTASKLDRSQPFIHSMMAYGEKKAMEFMEKLP
ncbi:Patatin-like phospholipase [uncultured archaeon]|nr:Patatin-like phospholipase [uncultured archaeon]